MYVYRSNPCKVVINQTVSSWESQQAVRSIMFHPRQGTDASVESNKLRKSSGSDVTKSHLKPSGFMIFLVPMVFS